MHYSPLTIRAMQLAYRLHHGQTDKSGAPYILHSLQVAQQMCTEAETIAALLHDTIEDTGITADELAREGFPDAAVMAVLTLTKREGQDYETYIRAVKADPVARKVKIADLAHNMDLDRLMGNVTQRDLARVEKYKKAYEFLNCED